MSSSDAILAVSLVLGGLGLLTLLPWRGGTRGWIGCGLLACGAAGVSVFLAGDRSAASGLLVWGVGGLGILAVASAVAAVVASEPRWSAVGYAGVVAASSLLVGVSAGWAVGIAVLVVHATLAARFGQRPVEPNVSSAGDASPDERGLGEASLAVVTITAFAGGLLLMAFPATDLATDLATGAALPTAATGPAVAGAEPAEVAEAAEPSPYPYGSLVAVGALVVIGLAYLGVTHAAGITDEAGERAESGGAA